MQRYFYPLLALAVCLTVIMTSDAAAQEPARASARSIKDKMEYQSLLVEAKALPRPLPEVHRLWLSGGISNHALGSAPLFELGWRGSGHLGFSMSMIFSDDTKGVTLNRTIDCAVYTCDSLGERRKSNAVGADLKYFFFAKTGGMQPFMGAGVYWGKKINVIAERSTGKKYVENPSNSLLEKDTETHSFYPNAELGVFWEGETWLIGLSYGLTKAQLSVGFSF